ncbi:putative mitochondrial protein [Tanacetum coccineum]
MQHPVDGRAWKNFDTKYPNFAQKKTKRKMIDRDGAADGFNPFGNLSQAYSMWPVILTTYNLPLWLCMKESSFMLTLLIPGPKSSGKDIDVYLRPLIDDSKVLWALKGRILKTLHKPESYKASPTCNKDTPSVRVLGKTAYVGHRRFLKKPHKWRRSLEFNGEIEDGDPPRKFDRDQIQAQLARLPTRVKGKHPSYGGVKIKRNVLVELNWTKRSIFYELEYWSFLTLKHNLDIMHIEKNVLEAILNTLLMNDKSKDTAKARQDLKKLGIRSGLWLGQTKNGKCSKPQAAYSFSPENRKKFCQFIKGVKLPDGHLLLRTSAILPYEIRQRHVDNDPGVSATSELFALACGPTPTPISVNSCVVNGVSCVGSEISGFDTRNEGRKVQRLVLRNNMTQILTKGEAFKDDQYILATQVKQCFYLEDMARRPPHWKVVEHVNHKKGSIQRRYASPDNIDLDEDDRYIDDEDALPHDLAIFRVMKTSSKFTDDECVTYLLIPSEEKIDLELDVNGCATATACDVAVMNRPPSHQNIPTVVGGCFANRGKGTLKPICTWQIINAGPNQSTPKAYNTNKALTGSALGYKPRDRTYDVETIDTDVRRAYTCGRLGHAHKCIWNDPRNQVPEPGSKSPKTEPRARSQEMVRLRLKALTTDSGVPYTEKRSMPWLKGQASGAPSRCWNGLLRDGERCFAICWSLGKVARERIPGELSPSNYPGRHVARDKYPQRHVARESVEMSLGIVNTTCRSWLNVGHTDVLHFATYFDSSSEVSNPNITLKLMGSEGIFQSLQQHILMVTKEKGAASVRSDWDIYSDLVAKHIHRIPREGVEALAKEFVVDKKVVDACVGKYFAQFVKTCPLEALKISIQHKGFKDEKWNERDENEKEDYYNELECRLLIAIPVISDEHSSRKDHYCQVNIVTYASYELSIDDEIGGKLKHDDIVISIGSNSEISDQGEVGFEPLRYLFSLLSTVVIKSSTTLCPTFYSKTAFYLLKLNSFNSVFPNTGMQLMSLSTESQVVPKELQKVVDHYDDVFAVPKELPPQRSYDHKIPLLEGTQPVNIRLYRHPPTQKDAIEAMVKELLEARVIKASNSPFASPIMMVKKKDNTWRMCVDYRKLNKNTVKDKFPIPIIKELIDKLHGAVVFYKLDLRYGYHQIRICEEDIAETAFKTHEGHYEFLVMPFGLTNTHSTFQALMNEVFKAFLRKFNLEFFDDILVYSQTMEEHETHLQMVLETMRKHKLYAKLSKCVFGTIHVEYLGHVILKEGVSTEPNKVKAMQDWPIPTTLKQLRGFLGLTRYYRRFIKGFASLSRPLTQLLKNNAFKWNLEAQLSFEALKKAMVEAPVLGLPDFNEPFVIETDASGVGLGVGSKNGAADALSRFRSGNELLSMFVSSITINLLKKVQDTWLADDAVGVIITNLRNGQPAKQQYAWVNENLLRKGKLVVGQDANLRRELLKYFHRDSIGGHSRVKVTSRRLCSVFYWKDFIEGLPKSHGKDFIMVVVDMLSNLHPQTDEQTEVVNRCLEGYLRCMTGEQPKKWIEWLPLAELWYNTNFYTSINTTPFEVVYGQAPPIHVPYLGGLSKVDAVDKTLLAREEAIQLLKFHL